jgi:hypothetical protein
MNDVPPPAAWYPDPTGRWEHRFWDGVAWTDHVSRDGVAATDPIGRSSVPTVADAPASGHKPGLLSRMSAERNQKKADRAEFEGLARAAAHGDESALKALPEAVSRGRNLWRGAKFEQIVTDLLAVAIRDVLSDDVLSATEEDRLVRTAGALGTTFQALQTAAPQAFEELVIAKINAGRPPVLHDPPMLLNKDEVAYGSFAVDLMKEVTLREFRGGSSGVSVPLGHGVRYRVGAFRGRSVVVGTQLVSQDSGMLTVTSKRAVFTGQKKTLEFRRDRLVGMEQFTDGIRLNVSNRQTASLFRLRPGQSASILGALIAAG